jgi:hypothetical protein
MGTDIVPEYGDFKQEAWIDFLGSPTLVSASHTAPVTVIVIELVPGKFQGRPMMLIPHLHYY